MASLTENSGEMEEMTTVFYKNLYTSEGVHNMAQVLEIVPYKVTAEMNEALNAPYTQREVKQALFRCFQLSPHGPMVTQLTFFSAIGTCAVMM